jgi:tRNA threonylcarbamoyladenosine biosynthesis protein TsaE
LGLEEQLFGDGICVVEWADRAEDLFPEESLFISLEYGRGQSERFITLESHANRFLPLFQELGRLFPAAHQVLP